MSVKNKVKPQITEAEIAKEEFPPNIKWVGLHGVDVIKPKKGQAAEDVPEDSFAPDNIARPYSEPAKSLSIGGKEIAMPSPEVQRAGWYTPFALQIVTSVGGYKLIVGGRDDGATE